MRAGGLDNGRNEVSILWQPQGSRPERCKLQMVFKDIRDYSADLSLFLEDSLLAWDLNWYLWQLSSSSAAPHKVVGSWDQNRVQTRINSWFLWRATIFNGLNTLLNSLTLLRFFMIQLFQHVFLCNYLCPLTRGNVKHWTGLLNITCMRLHKWHKWSHSLNIDTLHTLGPKMLHLVNQIRLLFQNTMRTSPSKQDLATVMRLARWSVQENERTQFVITFSLLKLYRRAAFCRWTRSRSLTI